MKPLIFQLKGLKASDLSPDFQINCFTTVVSYFENKIKNGKMTAQEMLDWIQSNTVQIEKPELESILIVWFSSNTAASPDKIKVDNLNSKISGYPFGLIMEHAAVFISETELFQKASPMDEDKFETINFEDMINKTYANQTWVRYSHHRVC